MKKISLICFLLSIYFISSANELNFCFYDIDASRPLTDSRVQLICKKLGESQADVILLAGIKTPSDMQQIQKQLKNFKYAKIINGEDKSSHLAFLAKKEPELFQAITNQKYVIKDDIKLPVKRGFAYAVFNQNGYKLHLFGADLKNRDQHHKYNQTDMRRYEARLLRQLVNKIQKKKPEANILILGNLNDTCGKSPIKDIYNRRFGVAKRLFDLRPLDKMNVSWTYISRERDEYERLDYAISSSSLIPEIMFNKNRIINDTDWENASSHRPITVSVSCQDRALWTKEKITSIFPNAIRTPEYISPPIGDKRKRGSE